MSGDKIKCEHCGCEVDIDSRLGSLVAHPSVERLGFGLGRRLSSENCQGSYKDAKSLALKYAKQRADRAEAELRDACRALRGAKANQQKAEEQAAKARALVASLEGGGR